MKQTQESGKAGKRLKVVIGGGGTGGHIFPALSIADELKGRLDADILFVGAEGRMEMTRVPEAGYRIIGLPVAGFDRKKIWRNFGVILKLLKSLSMAKSVLKDFNPDIAVGVGGYASGPILKEAAKRNLPIVIQEQNSFAGVTNRMLGKNAAKICVAYDGMERFFPAEKIVKTGNPIRKTLLECKKTQAEARAVFGLESGRKTVLVVGGSLGALTINESMEQGLQKLVDKGIQVIWQTGKNFGERGPKAAKGLKGVVVTNFVTDMGSAYKAADLVVSRAGAASISELQALGKAAVLVPSPNVAEDHQTHNAKALSSRGAAILIPDNQAKEKLIEIVIDLIENPQQLDRMSEEIRKMGIADGDSRIVDEICSILEKGK